MSTRIRSIAVLAAMLLASCSSLPRSGPDDGAIEKGAAVKVSRPDKKIGIDYALIDINKEILSYVSLTKRESLRGGFGGGRGGAPSVPLGVGDVIEISVFEAGSGGLFIPADAGSRPGNFITLPRQTVDSAGAITVPYAGRISVAGRRPGDVQAEIENALANRAIEPQVVVSVIESRSSEVSVLGDVNSPAKFEINPSGERILDVVSRAGGLSTPGIETYVTLQRGGRQATILFDELVKNPRENIYVAPGDTVFVNRERRTYLAFGASGLNGRFDFEEADLSLGDAIGKAGGLLDSRADPAQVLLYRVVDRELLNRLGVDTSKMVDNDVPVIFRANLRDPAAFFAVQKFPMQDKDVLYISNSDSVELIKFLTVINSVSSTAAGVPSDAVSARDAIRELGD